jgi:hypothetical protein
VKHCRVEILVLVISRLHQLRRLPDSQRSMLGYSFLTHNFRAD